MNDFLSLLFGLFLTFCIDGIFKTNRNARDEPPKYWQMKIDSVIEKSARHTDEKFFVDDYRRRMDSLKNEIKSEH